MFWVAPVRPRAVIAIWAAAIAVGAVLVFASYFFHSPCSGRRCCGRTGSISNLRIRHAGLLFADTEDAGAQSGSGAGVASGTIAYFGWKRTRYFGNTAPLLITALLFILAVASPDFSGQGFHLRLLAFLFVFVGGIFADLWRPRQGLVTAGAWRIAGCGRVLECGPVAAFEVLPSRPAGCPNTLRVKTRMNADFDYDYSN